MQQPLSKKKSNSKVIYYRFRRDLYGTHGTKLGNIAEIFLKKNQAQNGLVRIIDRSNFFFKKGQTQKTKLLVLNFEYIWNSGEV